MIRDIEFRIPVQVSILSERRVYHPYGLEGGGDGGVGVNYWVRKVRNGAKLNPASDDHDMKEAQEDEDIRWISLGGKNTALMQSGERIVICTPGGGGWGKAGGQRQVVKGRDETEAWRRGSLAQRLEAQETSI